MATTTQTATTTQADPGAPKTGGSGLVPYRLTVRQFEKMIDAGIFRDRDHVELLGGILVDKMKKNEPHNFGVGELADLLREIIRPDWIIREEKPIYLSRFSRPEPDIAVVRAPRERYRTSSPRIPDIGLLVEVADTSYAKDRGIKWRKYATAGIAVCWIVDVPRRRLEVFSSPAGKGKTAVYRQAATYGPHDEVPVIVNGRELGRIKVSDIV
jgi:Uma2 family endonuclease